MVSTASRPEDADEAHVRAGFWPKIRAAIAYIPFAEDALAAYYCAFDRETPLYARATLWGALAYFILPFDAVPDYLPLIGFADDATALATALRLIASHMKPEHREAAKRAVKRLAGN
ncbi:MAG TPA: YkvA family protein [Xanthobacteraceae bacterium]|nr:YkvA family protein [Xanthobacteraceae bacterium]